MLNHPHRRPQPIDASAAKFLPIPLPKATEAPVADRGVLETYTTEYRPLFERFDRERELARRGAAPTAGAATRHLPPVSTVPQVFLAAEFDLGKQYTFDLVTERYKQASSTALDGEEMAPYGVVLNQMLQEKLSYYSDVIEQHLVSEISARSASFFDALSTLQNLGTETSASVEQLALLQTHLGDVEAQVADGLRLVALEDEREQLAQEELLLHNVQRVLEHRDLLVLLVQHGEWENALAVLDEIRAELKQKLEGIDTLQSLTPHLAEAQASISEALQRNLQALVHERLATPTPLGLVLKGDATGVLPTPTPAAPSDWQAMRQLVELLLRCDGVAAAMERFADDAGARLVRVTSATLSTDPAYAWLAPVLSEDQAADAAIESIRSAPWDAYLGSTAALLRALVFSADRCTQLVADLHVVVPRTQSAAHAYLNRATESSWAHAQRIASRVLSIRTPRLAEQTLPQFVPYFSLVWRFVLLTEEASEHPVGGLRCAVLAQAKTFLGSLHKSEIEQAVKAVEDEVWSHVPVSQALDRLVQELLVCAEKEDVFRLPLDLDSAPPAPTPSGPEKPTLTIDGQRYFVVRASDCVLHLLRQYVFVVFNMPMFAPETLGWVVEFLKQFNSRTCQVVLGAGAMRSAGLKNITARHLALASQSLSLMVTLIGPLRTLFKRHLRASQAVLLTEFEKLQRDFREHQLEIHAKLVAIMADRVQVHARALAASEWDAPVLGELEPDRPLQDLVRETGTLHRVMAQYLEPTAVDQILSKVFQDVDVKLGAVLSRVDRRTPEVHRRLVCDANYVMDKLRELHEPAWQGERLAEVAKAKPPVPIKAPAQPRTSVEADAPQALGYRARFSFGKRPQGISPRRSEDDAHARPAAVLSRGDLPGNQPVNVPLPPVTPTETEVLEKGSSHASAAPKQAEVPRESSEAPKSARAEAPEVSLSTPAGAIKPVETPETPKTADDTERAANGAGTEAARMPSVTEVTKPPVVPPPSTKPILTIETRSVREETKKEESGPAAASTQSPRTDPVPTPVSPPRASPSEAATPSTPAPVTPAKDGAKVPRSTGRTALQQRLAESMRRRQERPRGALKPAETPTKTEGASFGEGLLAAKDDGSADKEEANEPESEVESKHADSEQLVQAPRASRVDAAPVESGQEPAQDALNEGRSVEEKTLRPGPSQDTPTAPLVDLDTQPSIKGKEKDADGAPTENQDHEAAVAARDTSAHAGPQPISNAPDHQTAPMVEGGADAAAPAANHMQERQVAATSPAADSLDPAGAPALAPSSSPVSPGIHAQPTEQAAAEETQPAHAAPPSSRSRRHAKRASRSK